MVFQQFGFWSKSGNAELDENKIYRNVMVNVMPTRVGISSDFGAKTMSYYNSKTCWVRL